MAKYVGYKRPKDTKKTVKHLLTYLGHYKWAFLLIAILVFISAGAGIMGTFLIKPVVNNFIVPGNMKGLIMAVCGMGVMYACGALSTLGYNRLMVHTSQKVVSEIRMDKWINATRVKLKKNILIKQDKEEVNNRLYSAMHDILGPDVMKELDKVNEEEV